jgi:hypothetical protein
LRPALYEDGSRQSWATFSVDVLRVADFRKAGTEQIAASLGLHAADAEPLYPVIIRWQATTGGYSIGSIFSGQSRPRLHGAREWQRGYSRPELIVNGAQPQQRFHSGWAEALAIEGSDKLLGVFYGHAKDRADPRDFEVEVWSLAQEGTPRCVIGRYPGKPLFISAAGLVSYDGLMATAWQRASKQGTACFF